MSNKQDKKFAFIFYGVVVLVIAVLIIGQYYV